jgi:hypothetical protein
MPNAKPKGETRLEGMGKMVPERAGILYHDPRCDNPGRRRRGRTARFGPACRRRPQTGKDAGAGAGHGQGRILTADWSSVTGGCHEWTVAHAEWPRSGDGARLHLGLRRRCPPTVCRQPWNCVSSTSQHGRGPEVSERVLRFGARQPARTRGAAHHWHTARALVHRCGGV